MFKATVVDNTRILWDVVRRMSTGYDIPELFKTHIANIGQVARKNIVRTIDPRGEHWTEEKWTTKSGLTINHGRPSLRLHNTTFAMGLGPPVVEKFYKGARVVIENSTPQAAILVTGAREHPIHNWGYRLAWWRIQDTAKPQYRWEVWHPGFEKYDFVQIAIGPEEGHIRSVMSRAGADAMFVPLRKVFTNP
jgi:hypothetical protein